MCRIVDVGHRRPLDVAIELPDDELGAVSTHEQLAAVLERIAVHVRAHRTTLVFVNTRRMAERIAHRLGELVGDDLVQAHHGSLSMDRRLRVEGRLRAGDLRAVVATASLELGIDVGPVELVCQIGSPRAISTWLQRVGRAQHHVGGTPTGRLYPLTRDELVECTALLSATRRGELDATLPPVAPLDILAQQVVAEVAAAGPEGIAEDALFELMRRAAPYSGLERAAFEEIVELVTSGVQTGRGRRGSYVHRDGINHVLRPRRGARLTATTSGGAIPELADYRVILEPEETLVGTVNEDWAIESMAGDVFLLGSHTWRIRRVEAGTVRVVDAAGASPSVPFWLGEAPARTDELSRAVSELRESVELELETSVGAAAEWVKESAGVDARAADQVVAYLSAAKTELGALPTAGRLVVERFFDDTGGMQLVLHSPRGGRINRGLGLALRKRFCRSFDFELQAAANDDAVVLSLGPQHSFPLAEVVSYLAPGTIPETLTQAVLPTPIFGGPLALEPLPFARLPPLPREPPPAAGHPADGSRRPDGGHLPRSRRLPGERHRADRDPRPPRRAPDASRLLHRGDGSRRADDVPRAAPQGRDRDALRRLGGALHPFRGDPERTAVHLPRRRPPRGAAHEIGAAAAGGAARVDRPRPSRRGGRRTYRRPGPSRAEGS